MYLYLFIYHFKQYRIKANVIEELNLSELKGRNKWLEVEKN